MARYKLKLDQVAANEQLVRDVYAERANAQPSGSRYETFKLDDGVSLVHLATQEGDNPIAGIAAFQRFQEGIGDRCDQPPVVTEFEGVGSFHFHGDPS